MHTDEGGRGGREGEREGYYMLHTKAEKIHNIYRLHTDATLMHTEKY